MLSIMTDADFAKTYQILPLQVKEQLSNYLQFLLAQYHIDVPTKNDQTSTVVKKKRQLGGLEGKIWMSDDFNEPMDDFKEYM